MSEQLDSVVVGGQEYRVIKTGRAQAEQVAGLAKWISKHGTRAFRNMNINPQDQGSGLQIVLMFIESLDADALVDLFTVMVGCPKEVSEVYFDIADLVDVVINVYERNNSLKKLIDRFFSSASSTNTTQEPSTTSEQPMDGQTM